MQPLFDPFDPEHWRDAPGCEAFELAIDMHRRAALAPSAIPVLETHLASCESCRAYEQKVGQLDAALGGPSGAPPAPPEWERIHARLQAGTRPSLRRLLNLGLTMVLGTTGYAYLARLVGVESPSWTVLACVAIGFIGVFGLIEVHNARRLRRTLAEKDVIAAHRRNLERAVRAFQVTGPIHLLVAGAQALRASGLYAAAMGGDAQALFDFVVTSALSLGMVAVFIVYRLVLPRMRRELELLR